ncbi:MAG: glycoside hydrolase family 20 zincin-like fold domain-containing protein [Victivallaceae bacterium]|nr:glycoside hydrolase family 20 zincin-like fold domain-containing protein [Victivallaceae bacterium]
MENILKSTAAALLAPISLFAAVTVQMKPIDGLQINTPFCELSTASRLIAIEPPWGHCYFNNGKDKVDISGDGQAASMLQAVPNEFELTRYTATTAGDTATVTLECKLVKDVKAFLEYTAFAVPGYVLAGSDYSAVSMDGKTVSGHIDTAEAGEIYRYAENFKTLEVISKLGRLNIEVVSGPGLNFLDRRGTKFMDRGCYWIGNPHTALEFGKILKSEIKISFTPAGDLKIIEPALPSGNFSATDDPAVVKPAAKPEIPLVPVPRSLEKLGGTYTPGGQAVFKSAFTGRDGERLRAAASRLTPDATVDITIDAALEPEEYRLTVLDSGLNIAAAAARGAFYALQTAARLEKNGAYPQVKINDGPDLPFRGVHLCLDAGDRTYYELVEKVLAPSKINTVVGEVEYVQWDATKPLGIHQEDGMTKEQLAEFAKLCDDNFIDFIPLMQTLGHCGWLFANGRNSAMAEDTDTPYAYNVSNPAVYPLMSAILDELFAIRPFDRLHIGHDEVTMRGRFPHRPENVAKGIKQIVFDDVMFYYNYAKKHNAEIMMWHDMFMTPDESLIAFGGAPNNLAELRQDLPRDIVFCVWRYTGDSFPEFRLLKKEGFEVIGCSWYVKNNPEQLAETAIKEGTSGVLATTWAGYFGSKTLLSENFYQVEPYVRSAAWGWRTSRRDNSGINFSRLLCDLLTVPGTGEHSGTTIDLSGAANLPLARENAPFLLCDNMDIDLLPEAGYFGDTRFILPRLAGKPAAVAFKSRLNPLFPENSVPVPVNRKASSVRVLATTAGLTPPDKTPMFSLTLNYADGSSDTLTALSGIDTGAPSADFNLYLPPYKACTWRSDGAEFNIWSSEFKNPEPDKEIASIVFSGSPEGFACYILGLALTD